MEENYFTVTPMTNKMDALQPGKTYTGSIKIINPVTAKSDFRYTITVAPYGVMGEDYDISFTTDSNYTMLTDWVKVDKPKGAVAPNHSEEITYTVTVPDNAPAGGQYAALIVSQDPEASEVKDSTVAVKDVYEIASLIYADVAGETIKKGDILENNIPAFVAEPPITVSSLFTNDGNVHSIATVVIEATDFFTGNVILSSEDNRYTEIIMPETKRFVTRDISENLPQLGIVHIKQTIHYLGNTSEESRDVIICPIWFLILVFCVIAFLISFVVYLVHYHRHKHKKRSSEQTKQ